MSSTRRASYDAKIYSFRLMWPPPWQLYAPPYGYPPPKSELKMLESLKEELELEREALSQEIENIEKRIEGLTKIIEEGGSLTAAPTGTTSTWGPAPYEPTLTVEREREMLERRAESLERQIDAAKKLEELSKENNV